MSDCRVPCTSLAVFLAEEASDTLDYIQPSMLKCFCEDALTTTTKAIWK